MKTSVVILCLAGLASPFTLLGQTSVDTSESDAQAAGVREFTLGGSGQSNKHMDDSMGGVDFSYGSFLSPNSQWALRQSISYANPNVGDSGWNGATRLVYDYSFNHDGFARPFIGAGGGRIYGDTVNDAWTAGLEVGSKFFVRSRTFIYAMASYDWLFDRGSQIDDRFDDGRIGWNLGIGYQF
ncbi:MAG TPA: hypothetical protein VG734_09295 [Lacunisphaera sp.]|nr:hypothetical protein [Lacunisphaera sp.]